MTNEHLERGPSSQQNPSMRVEQSSEPPLPKQEEPVELKPCPFCGEAPVTERTGFSGRALYIYCINDNGCPRPKAVGETVEKAIENWNTRPSLDARMREALEEAQFLVDLLDEFNPEDEEAARDFYGHVSPPLSRLKRILATLSSPVQSGKMGGEG